LFAPPAEFRLLTPLVYAINSAPQLTEVPVLSTLLDVNTGGGRKFLKKAENGPDYFL
jgi:hypothetical protein